MKRAIVWLVINTSFAYILYLYLFQGNIGAGNLFTFFVWAELLLRLMCIQKDFRPLAIKDLKPFPVPWEVSVAFDIAMISVMVWHGIFVTSIAYLISSLCQRFLYKEAEEYQQSRRVAQ